MHNPLASVLPPDQADLILIMIISIPLSYLLSLVNNKYIYLSLSCLFTIIFQTILFPQQRWFLWAQQQIVYLLVIFSPRSIVGHIVILQSFIALILLQLRRWTISYGENTFDVTAIFMMQLFNYIGLGYNYQNGAKPQNSLSQQQISRRIIQKPNYLTYLGYVNFMPGCLVGPVYQYRDYDDYLHRKNDYANIPDTKSPIFKQLGVFVFSLVLYGATSIFGLSRVLTTQFSQYNIFYRFLYYVLTITHIQLKYVTAWSLGMVSMRASGITYNPKANIVKDNKIVQYNFSKIEVNNMTKFYLQPNMKVKADNWNISVQWALRRYVYQNLYNPKQITDEKKRKRAQSRAQISTVLVSALWHGLYPGYFVSFFHWILYVQITQNVYRLKLCESPNIINKLYKNNKKIFDIAQNLVSTFVMTYFGIAFHLMTWSRVWKYLKDSLFIPYIILYISFFLIVKKSILGKVKSKQQAGKLVNKTQKQE